MPTGHLVQEKEYYALALKRGFCFLGPYTGRTKDKSSWQCENFHVWEATYNNIFNGSGCPFCSGYNPKSENDYHALALSKNFVWLGKALPDTVKQKTEWKCSVGHRIQASYSSIKTGRPGCPYCSNKAKATKRDYFILASEAGITWLGKDAPANINTKTFWQCQDNHTWNATYKNIKHNATGCPQCAKNTKITRDKYLSAGRDRGITWCGATFPKNTNVKTFWKCKNGHKWEASYASVAKNQTGCPRCYKDSKYGSTNPNWNSTLTEENRQKKRTKQEYSEWRGHVYKRDKYRCVVCNSKKEIVAHHLFDYARYKDRRTDINNGITLCKKCHVFFHNWMGHSRKSCTVSDFTTWLEETQLMNDKIKRLHTWVICTLF